MSDPPVENSELLYRRIRTSDIKDGRIQSNVFKLRPDEDGLSVDRAQFVSVEDALSEQRGALPNMKLASATAGEIRELKNGAGEELHLDVIPDDEGGEKPGHALIIVQNKGKLTQAASKALQRLFDRRELIEATSDTG